MLAIPGCKTGTEHIKPLTRFAYKVNKAVVKQSRFI